MILTRSMSSPCKRQFEDACLHDKKESMLQQHPKQSILQQTKAAPSSAASSIVFKKKSARRADPQQEAATAVHACMTKRYPSFSGIQSNPFFSKQKQPHRQQPRALFLKRNRPEGPIRNKEPQQQSQIQ